MEQQLLLDLYFATAGAVCCDTLVISIVAQLVRAKSHSRKVLSSRLSIRSRLIDQQNRHLAPAATALKDENELQLSGLTVFQAS